MSRAQSALPRDEEHDSEIYENAWPAQHNDVLFELPVEYGYYQLDDQIQPYDFSSLNTLPDATWITPAADSSLLPYNDSTDLYDDQEPDLLFPQNNLEATSETTMNSMGRRDVDSNQRQSSETRNMRPRKPSKKEPPKSTSPEDESNAARQRGRPRLDTRDQTAAERRRTQIRLAQRAYRQRKETTISGLNKRVLELEHTIHDMNTSFIDFNDKANASGFQQREPDLAQDLKSTMGQIHDSTRNITESDAEEAGEAPALSSRVYGSDEAPLSSQTRISRRPKYSPQAKASSSTANAATIGTWGYEAIEVGENEVDVDIAQRTQIDGGQDYQVTRFSEPEWNPRVPMQQYRVELPDLTNAETSPASSFVKALPLPSSYSGQETSFSRRLLRQTLEGAYQLMTNSGSSSADVLRMCRFTFCFSNSQRVINQLRDQIMRTAKDNLELWDAPQLHLGGAGLHYPRVTLDGPDSSPPAWWELEAPMGPFPYTEAETPVSKELGIEQIVELTGFDGEWFDSNDVELYLRSLGLYLDGQSSWVELDVPQLLPSYPQLLAVSLHSDSSLTSFEGPHSPQNGESVFPAGPIFNESDYSWNLETLDLPDFFDTSLDFSIAETSDLGPKIQGLPDGFGAKTFPAGILPDFSFDFGTTKKKFIDVQELVSSIVKEGVCLGRTPGFRREAVDSALAMATHEGF